MKKYLRFAPLFLLLLVMSILVLGLLQTPKQRASTLLNQPFPTFIQQDLFAPYKQRTPQDFPDKIFLLNVWGSWCAYCRQEHRFLMSLSSQIPVVGLNYRDRTENAIQMLSSMGNPFLFNISDPKGELSFLLGVDGAPETYLIDQSGIIRYRYSGVLNQQVWQQKFLPEIQGLRQE